MRWVRWLLMRLYPPYRRRVINRILKEAYVPHLERMVFEPPSAVLHRRLKR